MPQPAATTAWVHFGDSITCGNGSSSLPHSYPGMLDSTVAGPNANYCIQGGQGFDISPVIYNSVTSTTAAGQPAFTLMIGTNDVFGRPLDSCLDNYTRTLLASAAYLAMPESDRTWARSIADRTGTWDPEDTIRPGSALSTLTPGSALTLHVNQAVADRSLIVAWKAMDNNGTGAEVEIDGQAVGHLSTAGFGTSPITTPHLTTSAVFASSYSLGPVGRHTVRILFMPSGANPADRFTFLWAGVSSATYVLTGRPHLILGGVPREIGSRYDDVVSLYNDAVQEVVKTLEAQGLDVWFADTHNALDPTNFVDYLHPNDAGHAQLAEAFLHPRRL